MRVFVVLAAFLAAVSAEAPGGYGAPSRGGPAIGGYQQEQEQHTPQVFKHVYVHVGPEDENDQQSRVIRVPGGDKHVNIIFVKTPSSSSSQQTEVILPEQDEHKNLVYVLLKKSEASSDIKIRRPSAPRQQKPDVYFIRYKDQQAAAPQQPQGPSSYGAPAPVRTPSTSYGAF